MHRLYLQIYVTLLALLVALSILVAAAFWMFDRHESPDHWRRELSAFAEAILPTADAPPEQTRRVLSALAERLHLDISLFGPDRERLLHAGRPLDLPGTAVPARRPHRSPLVLELADGRLLVVDGERRRRPLAPLFLAIALLGLAIGLAALPLTRRLTRRLETLKQHIEALGEGRLTERVPVEGRDEIALLARSFNATADRIERLVSDKTRLLANTSHELRTPLTRVRMALELVRNDPRPELLQRIDRDVAELDDLIGELLLASRLDAPERPLDRESVDLLALAAEEAARLDGIDVGGTPALLEADPRLLRRLVRNLMQNALRHGKPPVEVRVESDRERVCMTIEDRGRGVPEQERERIFEPFYRPLGQASAEGGIGLGLALVRQIAERHGGSVRCEPREGEGTRFLLELPKA